MELMESTETNEQIEFTYDSKEMICPPQSFINLESSSSGNKTKNYIFIKGMNNLEREITKKTRTSI